MRISRTARRRAFSCAMATFSTASLLLAGCASAPQQPTPDVVRARTLIEQANQGGVQQHAAAELQLAQDKLAAAENAATDKKPAIAQRLAEEAALDAEYATVRAQQVRAENAAKEVREGIETLRREAATGGGSTP